MFFSFDGVDGGGKTTQIALFCDWLRDAGHAVLACRDPGSTRVGEAVRAIVLGERDAVLGERDLAISRRSEMLLYMAARAQLVEEIIGPALEAGQLVVADRYLLANVVYQGYAGGLDVESLWRVGEVATGGVMPNLTFVLDLSPAEAARRLSRPLDRMERQGESFRAALRAGYLAEAARQPEKIVVIDAARSVDEVQADIRRAASRLLA
jgi:dTMP kinase